MNDRLSAIFFNIDKDAKGGLVKLLECAANFKNDTSQWAPTIQATLPFVVSHSFSDSCFEILLDLYDLDLSPNYPHPKKLEAYVNSVNRSTNEMKTQHTRDIGAFEAEAVYSELELCTDQSDCKFELRIQKQAELIEELLAEFCVVVGVIDVRSQIRNHEIAPMAAIRSAGSAEWGITSELVSNYKVIDPWI